MLKIRLLWKKKIVNRKFKYKVITENNITLFNERYLYISIFKKWYPGKLSLNTKLKISKYKDHWGERKLKKFNS